MKNVNCLQGFACPSCGNDDTLIVTAIAEFELCDDGTYGPIGDVEFDDDSWMRCGECGYRHRVANFREEEEEE